MSKFSSPVQNCACNKMILTCIAGYNNIAYMKVFEIGEMWEKTSTFSRVKIFFSPNFEC